MSRLLILGIIAFVVVYYLKRTQQTGKQTPSASRPEKNEQMVKCAHCSIHVPRSEARLLNNAYYCCEAHQPRT